VLPPLELGTRLDRLLAHGERLVASLDIRILDEAPVGAGGSVRDLAFRLFRLGLAYVDGMDMGELPGGWLREPAPPDLVDGPSVARYGALVRGRIAGWFEGATLREFARTIVTPDGPQTGHALLERMTSLVALHLRQLHALATELGGSPAGPLPVPDFEGLPLPARPW
jgi:hypothetical protein